MHITEPRSLPNRSLIRELISAGEFDSALDLVDKEVQTISGVLDPFLFLQNIIVSEVILEYYSEIPAHERETTKLAIAILKRWPQNPYALWAISPLLSDKDAAQIIAFRAEKISPNSGLRQTVLMLHCNFQNDLEAMRKYAREAIVVNSNNPHALSTLAAEHFDKGEHELAVGLTGDAIKIAPNLPDLHYQLASFYQFMDRPDMALLELRAERLVHWDNLSAKILEAQILITESRLAEAIEILLPYAQLGDIHAVAGIVEVLLYQGKISLAREWIEYASQLSPNNFQITYWTAQIELADLNFAEAKRLINTLDTSNQSNPEKIDSPTLGYFLDIAIREPDIGTAKSLLEELRPHRDKLTKDTIEYYEAQIAMLTGNFHGALTILDGVDNHLFAFSRKARKALLDIYQGNPDALKNIEELEQKFPGYYYTRLVKATFFLKHGDYAKAYGEYIKLTKETGERDLGELLHIKGFALLGMGRFDEVFAVAGTLQRKRPRDSAGWLLEARALFGKGKIAAAKILAQKAKGMELFDWKDWPLMSAGKLLEEITAREQSKAR